MTWLLLHGDHRDVLNVVVDHTITDPPYGAGTHEGHNAGSGTAHTGFQNTIDYDPWTRDDVFEFVRHWSPRTRGWMVCMTSDDLIMAYRDAYWDVGRYDFATVPYVDFGKGPRVQGDGPASWCCYIMVARPRSKDWILEWRARRKALGLSASLDGAYRREAGDVVWTPPGADGKKRIGGKPLGLMRALVSDYSFAGEVIADPFAGHGTTLRAADELGRDAIGAERDREAFEAALTRLREPVALDMFQPREVRPAQNAQEQGSLPGF